MIIIHSDIISIVSGFLPLHDMFKLERVCKEWKLGLYHYCATLKSFQFTKYLLYLVQVPAPRPSMPQPSCGQYTIFNYQDSFIAPKLQHHRLIIRKMVSKWFGEMFVNVERLYFSDVRFSGDLVDDFFSNKKYCEKVRELVFVGCHLIKTCAKEFTKKMKNVECIIYYKNEMQDLDLKHLREFVKSSSLKFLYYPQADLVNLSFLPQQDEISPFYYELKDEYSKEDSEEAYHEVIIMDIEKTKQFQNAAGNFKETMKLFGIISNEFEDLFFTALKSPTNDYILQFDRLIMNGMHFFDVVFYMDILIPLRIYHKNDSLVENYLVKESFGTWGSLTSQGRRIMLKRASSLEEVLLYLEIIWNDDSLWLLEECEEKGMLEDVINSGRVDISIQNLYQNVGRIFEPPILGKVQTLLKKRKGFEENDINERKKSKQ